jgi:hypothetical protein
MQSRTRGVDEAPSRGAGAVGSISRPGVSRTKLSAWLTEGIGTGSGISGGGLSGDPAIGRKSVFKAVLIVTDGAREKQNGKLPLTQLNFPRIEPARCPVGVKVYGSSTFINHRAPILLGG